MNICLNAQLISDQSGYRGAGVNNYARQLLAALGEAVQHGSTVHRFTAFVHTPDLAIPGVELVVSGPLLERPAARIAWEQSVMALMPFMGWSMCCRWQRTRRGLSPSTTSRLYARRSISPRSNASISHGCARRAWHVRVT